MSIRHRKFGRTAAALLAAVASAGQVAAQPLVVPLAYAQPAPPTTPPAVPPAPPAVATVPVPATPAAPAAPGEKTVEFRMDRKSWDTVLEWLSEQTGLPVITTVKPTGSFSFISPPGTNRRYTVPEVIDILNEALLNQKFLLIRREASFTIVAADEKVDPAIMARVPMGELDKRGRTEMVSTVVQLNTLVAEDVAAEVKRMLGPFGEVTPLAKANQLLLTDTAGNLRSVIKTMKDIEQNEGQAAESYSHVCQYVRAREVDRVLRELMGDPRALMGQMQAAQQQQFDRSRDPRDQRPVAVAPPAKFRMYYFAADERTNTILVTGPADKIAQAKAIIQKVDTPQAGQKTVAVGPPVLKTYSVPGNAEAVARTLQDAYKASTVVRFSAVGTNQVMVWAGPEDQFEIARQLQGSSEDGKVGTAELIPLGTLDATRTAETLKGMFGDFKSGGPYIEGDSNRSAVIVKGSPEQVGEVKAALKAIGDTAPGSGNLRVITVDGASAATLAGEIERLMRQMGRPVRVISPGAPDPKPAAPPRPLIGPGADARQFGDTHLIAAQAQPQPAAANPTVTLTPFGNKLLVNSDDPQALATVNELVRLLTSTQAGEGDFEVIRLRNANAVDAAKIIDEAFNGRRQPAQPQGGGFPFGGGRFGGQQPVAATDTTTQKVRVVADPASNSLLVRARPLDMATVRRLVDEVDKGETDSNAVIRTNIIGPLKSANATEVAQVIRDVYREQTGATSAPQPGGGFAGFLARAQQAGQQQGDRKPAQLSVGVDDRTNSLIVACPDALFQDVKKLVDQLEEAAKDSSRTVKIVQVTGVDPVLVQQAIDAIQGRRTQSRANTAAQQQPQFGGQGNFQQGGRGNFQGGQGGGRGNQGGGGGRNPGGGGGGLPGQRNRQASDDGGPGLRFFEPGVTDDLNPTQSSDTELQPTAFQQPAQPPAAQPAALGDIRGPRSTVNAEALQELGVVVLSGNNQADVEEVVKLIELLQRQGANAETVLRLVPLEFADATSVSNTLTQVFARVNFAAGGNVAVRPTGQTTALPNAAANSSILLQPIPRFNAILVGAPLGRLKDVEAEIKKLDLPVPVVGQPTAFSLKRASASRVANLVLQFYAQRYPNETSAQNQVRVTADEPTNTVLVQASPADLAEIRALIERLDTTVSSAVNEVRVVRLKSASAAELANLLLQSLARGTATAGVVPAQATTGGGGGFPGAPSGTPRPTVAGAATTAQAGAGKTATLRFVGGRAGTAVESGLLEDVLITPDARTNSLIIAAPAKTLDLLLALINELDTVSSSQSRINIFNLRKADANLTASLLQQLFLGTARAGTGAAAAAATRPLISAGATDASPLLDLRISADDRTNSVIVVGGLGELEAIEAVIAKLEDADIQSRRNEVYKLRNAAAADVATALQNFLTSTLQVLQRGAQLTPFQDIQREVIVVAEPVTNTILISSTPQYFTEVQRLIATLDAQPPQVVVAVTVAEVQLNNTEEFGVELGLQSPVLFQRGVIPAAGAFGTTGTTTFANVNGAGQVPVGVTVNSTINPAAQPGFNFNNPALGLGNNPLVDPGVVGFQGLGALGVGRVSPTNGIGGFVFSAASDAFTLLVRALKTQGRIDILSRPQIMTLDNQTAFIQVGQSFPFVTGSNIAALGNVQNLVSYRDIGILLRVTPRINADGRVLMRVEPEVSSIQPTQVNLGNGLFATAFNVQQVSTTVAANDGETVAIGGLITKSDVKNENKIPLLGDLPWVGSLFRYRTDVKQKRELLIILTPHVVRGAFDTEAILREEAAKMDWVPQDVIKTHGPRGVEALLPPGAGAAASGGVGPALVPQPGGPQLPCAPAVPTQGTPAPVVPAAATAEPGKESRKWSLLGRGKS